MKQKVKALLVLFIFVTSTLVYANSEKNSNYLSKKTRKSCVNEYTTEISNHPLISKELWNTLFPYRFGSKDIGGGEWVLDPKDDFYTYESFIEAINRMSKIKVIFDRRCGTNSYKITRIDKVTGASVVIRKDVDFDEPRNVDKEIIIKEVDYGSFLEEGSTEERTRELIAFFANISHETTGGWATAPGGRFSWGLHFREEPTNASYASPDTNYPPTPGKSYKGRGPIQLSYNYNYGPASEFIFGDKQVLLDNPEKVIEDAALAFQTAIWFWMTPQYPKPSAHDVMTNNWIPNDLDKTKNRVPGLGMTVNIINGGVECGQGTEKPQVVDRIGYYERYAQVYNIGTDMDGVNDLSDCGCKDMSKYGGDASDLTAEPCAQKPAVVFITPINNQIIKQETFASIPISIDVDEKKSVLETITTKVGTESFVGTSFSWLPSSYGTHVLTTEAVFKNGGTISTSINIVIWDGVNLDCTDIPEWRSTKIYDKPNNYVKYNTTIYRNKWYAANGLEPDKNGVWEKIKECGANQGTAPIVIWNTPVENQVIEMKTFEEISLKATATDSDGVIQSFSFLHNAKTITATKVGNEYTATFTPLAFGAVTLKAVATDNSDKTTSKEIVFIIKEIGQNTSPVISEITPVNASVIEQENLSVINLKAKVEDNSSVSSVKFLLNEKEVTVTSTKPTIYSASWIPSVYGNVAFKIIAIDDEGKSITANSSFIVKKKTTGTVCETTPSWVSKIYSQAGVEVVYNGAIYKNKWYASSAEVPGESDVWSYIQSCNGSGDDYCGSPAWVSSKVYNTGDKVYYEGTIFEAKWWTKNNIPTTSNEWKVIEPCSSPKSEISSLKLYANIVSEEIKVTVELEKTSYVKIDLFDFSGRKIETIIDVKLHKGTNFFRKSIKNLKKGIYIYKTYVDGEVKTKKILKK
ncbi:glycoside hydrolase family 19 protein [Tenacibaculum halocynthiae]|uniref:glycoside hydrolase family 19 protein n=1 Tax=Tenacibaculum halocynthiae TaxID=1254437 RepID=UPI0038955ACE